MGDLAVSRFSGPDAGIREGDLRGLKPCSASDQAIASIPSEAKDGMSYWDVTTHATTGSECRVLREEFSNTAVPAPGLPSGTLSYAQIGKLQDGRRGLLNQLLAGSPQQTVLTQLRAMSKDEWRVTMDTQDLRLASAIIIGVFSGVTLTPEDTWVKDMLESAAPEARAAALYVLLVAPNQDPKLTRKQTQANIVMFSEMMSSGQPDGSGALLQALTRLNFP